MSKDLVAIFGMMIFLTGMVLGQSMENGKTRAAETRYERCAETRDEYHDIIKKLLPAHNAN